MSLEASKIQMQIRENNAELNDFLKDLSRWEESIKHEDNNLKSARRIEEKLPPIRSKTSTKSRESTKVKSDKNNNGQTKSARIKSYDYDAWEKFDVEAACKDESDPDETGLEEEDEEETQRIHERQKIQQASLEKEKGNQLFKEGKYEAAINRYTNAITLQPTNPILYANRGMALIKTERYGAAEQDCSTALEYDPCYTKALARRATALEKLKKYKLAIEDYQTLLKLEPKNKQALIEMGKLEKIITTQNPTTIKTHVVDYTERVKSPEMKPKSRKPLKRIAIGEIGIEESDEQSHKENSRTVTVHTDTISSIPTATTILTVPTTSIMFETEFKHLKNKQEDFYQYLLIIPPTNYAKLFHQCIDGVISSFLSTLLNCYKRDNRCFHDELEAITRVKRFDMAVMFLAKSEKETLQKLFYHMKTRIYPQLLSEEYINNLAKKCFVTL